MASYSSTHSNILSSINDKIDNFINIKNAVKILEVYSNWNGYIKLFTEIESNFEVDDIVYITYTNYPISGNIFNLENPDTPYEEWAMGYKVLFVNKLKNEVVINREYHDITSGYLLSNQYLSRVSVRGGSFNNGVTDGITFYTASIFSGVTFTQGVFKWCDISDITFNDKYKKIKTLYTTNSFTSSNRAATKKSSTATTFRNKNYYYNTISDCRLFNCNVENGKFSTSTFLGTSGVSYINDGIFSGCSFSGYTINNGHFDDCIVESNCVWNYGYWNNINGTDDFKTDWNDGVWNTGSFIGGVWSGGTFNAGVFSAATWKNGTVNFGNFYSTSWIDGLVRNANFYDSTWLDGVYNNGNFTDSEWSGGTFNNGTILGSTFHIGQFNDGNITGSTIKNIRTFGGNIIDTDIDGGNFYNSDIKLATINFASIHNGSVKNSDVYGGNLYNGYYDDLIINGNWIPGEIKIYNGQYRDCDFEELTVYNGNFTNCNADDVIFNNGVYNNGTFQNGYWNGGIWNDGDFIGTVFSGGDFYGGIFSGGTESGAAMGTWTATWSGGTFHYGYFKGVYRTSLPIYPKQSVSQQNHTPEF